MSGPRANNLLDARTLLAACGGDATLLRKVIQSFNSGGPKHLEAIGRTIEAGNAVELCKAAHKLRGFVATFSSAAAEVAQSLEQAGAEGRFDRAHEHYRRIAEMLADLSASLARLSLDELERLAGA